MLWKGSHILLMREESKKMQRKKTNEQIQRANLRKTLSKLKYKVADSEELWLDFFSLAMTIVISPDLPHYDMLPRVDLANALADKMLAKYEERWAVPKE